MPFHAPHLARHLRRAHPRRPIHKTFIDRRLQQTLEAMARRQSLEPHANLAILVVENTGRRVIGYLGGADFFASERAGQVDMVRAVRSPGSTLKPVVYGLGFDDLIIHPETLIDDTPGHFGDYSPTNFRDIYLGQISVREALQRSQNIPAVAVLNRLGPARVAARLSEAGITLRWGRAHAKPGLPLVLGGVGTTLADLVALYTGIANGGIIGPLRISAHPSLPLTKGGGKPSPIAPLPKEGAERRRLLSPSASWYLARILEEAPPPEAVVALGNTRHPRPIAYKTGTSYGFRDAWALGFDGNHTVGVWVGRPDGSPSPGHYGRNTAAPLLFRIFELLPPTRPSRAANIPEGVLLARHGDLPERLKYFERRVERRSGPALTIGFPLHGSTVELAVREGRHQGLPLVAKGGKKPLRWWVNGRPIGSSRLRRKAYWRPDGEGLARIAVVDGSGRTARAEVWIETAIR
jgi:penicillin-binding protein 1C